MMGSSRLLEFNSVDDFCRIHNRATEAERESELARLQRFNREQHGYKAYTVELGLQGESERLAYAILRVRLDHDANLFPPAGHSFGVKLVPDKLTSPNGKAMRPGKEIISPPKPRAKQPEPKETQRTTQVEDLAHGGRWKGYIEVEVGPGSWSQTTPRAPASSCPTSTLSAAQDLKIQVFEDSPELKVVFELRHSTHTRDLELKCLEIMKEEHNLKQLEYFISSKPSSTLNIDNIIPSLFDPTKISDQKSSDIAKNIIDSFNSDQLGAYNQLARLPMRNFFLPGCPRSGKTYWALSVALLFQTNIPTRVLYLMDINKPLLKIADRMRQRYEEVKMPTRVVALGFWPERNENQMWTLNGPPPGFTPTHFTALRSSPNFSMAFRAIINRYRPMPPAQDCEDVEGAWSRKIACG